MIRCDEIFSSYIEIILMYVSSRWVQGRERETGQRETGQDRLARAPCSDRTLKSDEVFSSHIEIILMYVSSVWLQGRETSHFRLESLGCKDFRYGLVQGSVWVF